MSGMLVSAMPESWFLDARISSIAMAFKIIRNDITKVSADAIVNTANPNPVRVSGIDLAIYEAAGREALLIERRKIGKIARGDVAVTNAYNLDAKYIIHTVGPVWRRGLYQELDILESCYKKSLEKAIELDCKNIAFPLISTGAYGFPKDKALQIAVTVFSQFLLKYDIQIILVVFGRRSFQLSQKIVGEIDSYIDNNYVNECYKKEYLTNPTENKCVSEYSLLLSRGNNIQTNSKADFPLNAHDSFLKKSYSLTTDLSLDDQLKNIGISFHDKLFELIRAANLDNKDVWKRANLDRKLFSKIQCNANYHPQKKTVMALCIALKLDLDQSKDLLSRADWAFSPSSKLDLIVQKAIIDKQYNIIQLNMILFKYTNEILGG